MNPPKILHISNVPSHHQMPLAEELYKICGDNFRMAFLDPPLQYRTKMGWKDVGMTEPWIIRVWESDAALQELNSWNDEADAVMYPNYLAYRLCPDLLKRRVRNNKLCLPAGERYFRPANALLKGWKAAKPNESLRPLRHIVRRLRFLREAWAINSKKCQYLAYGAYAAWDQRRIGMFKNRMWTWGYLTAMPETSPIRRERGTMKILWAGRMLDLKNVDVLVKACGKIKQRGIDFELTLVGDGPERENLQKLAVGESLGTSCIFNEFVSPDIVRTFMRSVHVYVLPSTSDEGWGAVLNEAMSEGCTVIGSTGAGASRILIKPGVNGLLFPTGDAGALAEQLEFLAKNPEKREEMGRETARYIRELWSPAVGAERLIHLVNGLLCRESMPNYTEGPCSPAKIWKDNS